MTISHCKMVVLTAGLGLSALQGQTAVGRILSRPLPSPQEMASLESHVLQNPEDIGARMELLQFYLDTAPARPYGAPGRRSVRLQHILYLVEHHPEAAVSASRAAYIYRANGPYADAADHDAVRSQWLAAVQAHPKDNAVTLHAVKFLNVEDSDDAEGVLRRALAADPENRELAANLGFQYATEILGNAPDLAAHASSELQQSSNAIVLAAAGTALPNLAVHRNGVPTDNQKIFDLATEVTDRARKLAPDDRDIQGPMPLIKYFADSPAAPAQAATVPTRIRIGENVQAYNLIQKTQPRYPEEAQSAGITGEVRLTVVIARDGTIEDVQPISGHPLLVQPAIQAAKTWLYKPTLLNGAPTEVVTTITLSFPAR